MTSGQIQLFISIVLSVGGLAFVVFAVIPSLAKDRLIDQLEDLLGRLDELVAMDGPARRSVEVAQLREVLSGMIAIQGSLGITWFVAVLGARRIHRHEPPEPEQRELQGVTSMAFAEIEERAILEILRASFFASQYWFITMLAWPYYRDKITRRSDRSKEWEIGLELLVAQAVRQRRKTPPVGSRKRFAAA